jgi:hypothetical protein
LDLVKFILSNCYCLNRRVFIEGDEIDSVSYTNLIQVWSFYFGLLVLIIRDWDTQREKYEFCRGGVILLITHNHFS